MRNLFFFGRRALSSLGLDVQKIDPLTQLANRFGSDKGSLNHSRHHYTRIYHHLLKSRRHEELTVLEIGLLRPDVDGRRGHAAHEGESSAVGSSIPSLRMWSEYFPKSKIIGYDIDDFTMYSSERIEIIKGDMTNPADLDNLRRRFPDGFDIIIDDASHVSHHQQICLAELFPHVKLGGFYIIEDLHWQDPAYERSDYSKTRDLLKRLWLGNIDFKSPISEIDINYLKSHIGSMHFFDSMEAPDVMHSDAMAVLKKVYNPNESHPQSPLP